MRRFVVIGLGEFGLTVAKTLVEEGGEVIAIDKDEERVEEVSDIVAQAAQIDATDEKALRAVGVLEADVVVVGMGTNIQASILTNLTLKGMGAKKIVAKAITPLHGTVLEKIGVDKVVYPEMDMGRRVARSLTSDNILQQIQLSDRHSFMEIKAPESFVNKTLQKLDVKAKHQVNIIAIKRKISHVDETGEVSYVDDIDISPSPDDVIAKDDILLVFGDNESIAKLKEA
ncbi:TPA: potassium uptake system protein [bacterium]|nr:potassium uptake system protein [bacterium]